MPKKVNKKNINERAVRMDGAWSEGAPNVEFMGVKLVNLTDSVAAIRAKEATREDLTAQLKMLDDELNIDYAALDDMMVSVGSGVRGNANFGDDSPLYGAMGFVRKSERASGLTRKTKTSDSK